MKRAKITIIGAGTVGAACAHWAAVRELGDVVLVDMIEDMPRGKALDLHEALAVEGYEAAIVGANDYEPTADSDVVLIAAAHRRESGVSTEKWAEANVSIIAEVTAAAVQRSPDAVLVVITSPLAATVYTAAKVSGFPNRRIVGAAGVLHTARYRGLVAEAVGCNVQDVHALLIGGQGDDMIPLPRHTTVSGTPVTQLVSPGQLEEIITRTRNGGAEIANLLEPATACYAPAAAGIAVTEAILCDTKRLMSCTAYCEKQYGVGGLFAGVPCVLGAGGVEKIVEVELDTREKEHFAASVAHAKKLCQLAKKSLPK